MMVWSKDATHLTQFEITETRVIKRMEHYDVIFRCAILLCAIATLLSSSLNQAHNNVHTRKQNTLLMKYLVVYLLAVCSDWVKGAYVYTLYVEYGFSQTDISSLFITTFGSAMIFGTAVGGLADSHGRKKLAIWFTIIHALSCATKHFNDYRALLLGSLLDGVAASLLFTVFDSWLVRSYVKADLSHCLPTVFATAEYSNNIAAILAGWLANWASSFTSLRSLSDHGIFFLGGSLNTFDFAVIALFLCGILIFLLWEDHGGEGEGDEDDITDEGKGKTTSWYNTLCNTLRTTMNSKEILYRGVVCSSFEGSMYIFVFTWTLSVTAKSSLDVIPFNLIFYIFMLSCMTGSSIYSILIRNVKNEKIGVGAFVVAAFSFILMITSSTGTTSVIAFSLFELAVGIYFPMMGTMKSRIVPESQRTTIYNLYRLPFNFIIALYLSTDLTPETSFTICFCMVITALYFQVKLLNTNYTLLKNRSYYGKSFLTKKSY